MSIDLSNGKTFELGKVVIDKEEVLRVLKTLTSSWMRNEIYLNYCSSDDELRIAICKGDGIDIIELIEAEKIRSDKRGPEISIAEAIHEQMGSNLWLPESTG